MFQATLATRMSATLMFTSVAQMLLQYGWNTHIGVLCGTTPATIQSTCDTLERTLTDSTKSGLPEVEIKRENYHAGEFDSISDSFQDITSLARSTIYLCTKE